MAVSASSPLRRCARGSVTVDLSPVVGGCLWAVFGVSPLTFSCPMVLGATCNRSVILSVSLGLISTGFTVILVRGWLDDKVASWFSGGRILLRGYMWCVWVCLCVCVCRWVCVGRQAQR